MFNNILNKLAFTFVGIILLVIITSVVQLAYTSSKNAKEVQRLTAVLQAKDIELNALQTSIQIEQDVAYAAEQENTALKLLNSKYLVAYEELQTKEKKTTVAAVAKTGKAKQKVIEIIEAKTNQSVLTLDRQIDVSGIADSQEVADFIQAQVQESNIVILSLHDHRCLIQEAEESQFGNNPQACSLQAL